MLSVVYVLPLWILIWSKSSWLKKDVGFWRLSHPALVNFGFPPPQNQMIIEIERMLRNFLCHCPALHRVDYEVIWTYSWSYWGRTAKISKNGACITSLVSLLHHLTIYIVIFFPFIQYKPLLFQFVPISLFLLLCTCQKSLSSDVVYCAVYIKLNIFNTVKFSWDR